VSESRLVELANAHSAWGCPQLHQQLRQEGIASITSARTGCIAGIVCLNVCNSRCCGSCIPIRSGRRTS
jgi:hypothetical protein